MRFVIVLLGLAILLLITPDVAWAFGPATHVYLGQMLLDSLSLLPEAIQHLLRAHPQSFLYGSMAADISFAKKYVPEGRHCHFWHVGEEIFDAAENERLKAAAYGYLSHLAADTVAHNYFVPRQLLLTSSTATLGHGYWEARLDTHLDVRYSSMAREVVMDYDHGEADALFDRVLSGTIFSFETNRRLFRGMIRFQDNDRWKAVFDRVVQRSRWDLSTHAVDDYLGRAFDMVVDYLCRRQNSIAASLDPTGEFNLRLSKRIRRLAMRDGAWRSPHTLIQMADDFFPLPDTGLDYWRRIQRSVRELRGTG